MCCVLQGGDEIIEALCKHSTTFEGKTEFAQEKYKRRKARKYLTRLTLRKPTGWTVCQVRETAACGVTISQCVGLAVAVAVMQLGLLLQRIVRGSALCATPLGVRAMRRWAMMQQHVQLTP